MIDAAGDYYSWRRRRRWRRWRRSLASSFVIIVTCSTQGALHTYIYTDLYKLHDLTLHVNVLYKPPPPYEDWRYVTNLNWRIFDALQENLTRLSNACMFICIKKKYVINLFYRKIFLVIAIIFFCLFKIFMYVISRLC